MCARVCMCMYVCSVCVCACVHVCVWHVCMCVHSACVHEGFPPPPPPHHTQSGSTIISSHLLSIVGYQLRPQWYPCSHAWHCCRQLGRYSTGNDNGCCRHPLRGRHWEGILKVATPIATLSYAEILQRSAYMAIGVVTNHYMCMKASLQLCPFQS